MSAPLYSSPLPRSALEDTLYRDGMRNTNLTRQEIGLTPKAFPKPKSQSSPDNPEIRVIDFTDGALGFSDPDGDFILSPAAKKARDFLSGAIGKDVILRSVSPFTESSVQGYFAPLGPEGSLDPSRRSVHVRSGVSYPVLFHEVGHAGDPALAERDFSINENYIRGLRSPAQRLNYLFERTGKPKVKSETEAQSFVGRHLPSFEKANPDTNSRSQEFFDAPYFKEYPASFAPNTVDNFYRAELGKIPAQFVTEEDADSGVALRTFSRSPETALQYALDQDLKNKEEEIKEFTRNYVDTRLNQFQSAPTEPDFGYFSTGR